jgi:hypothetical protein
MTTINTDNIKRCKRCVLPENLPSVHLDANGLCNHCRNYDKIINEWKKNKPQKEKELEEIINKVKHSNQKYDCLVTLSGGKDSTFALYLLGKVHKLKCLCVTFDNGFLSEHARKNITTATEAANADHIYYKINRNTLLKLYNLSIKKSGQFCSVCMGGIRLCNEFPLKSFDIPLKVSGDGKRVSYLNAFPEVFEGGNAFSFTKMVEGDSIAKEARPLLMTKISLRDRAINKIKRISRKLFKVPASTGPVQVQLYDYVEFSAEKIAKTIKEEMGWTTPSGEFEHMDCLLHEMQHYVNIFKFDEITMHTFYRSYLVRLGSLTREEAIAMEEDELKNPNQPEIFDSFLKQIKMSKDEFYDSVKDWRKLDSFRAKKLIHQ